MAGKRGDTLLNLMLFIELFTLNRAWDGLTDAELFWEPVPGSWSVRSRADCQTSTPFGDGDWVVDFDAEIAAGADAGSAVEPMTTIGWLLWHIGSQPGRVAELDFLGGPVASGTGWNSPYLTGHPVFTSGDDAVDTMRDGWRALDRALHASTDEELERRYVEYYGQTDGAQLIAVTLNEISHHGAQICQLRDLYRATDGRTLI
jgi:DinB superfamily